MAQATRIVTQPVPTPPDLVKLVLSIEEAQTLADVFSKVGGNPDYSRRGYIDAIALALRSVGVTWNREPVDMSAATGVYFKDNKYA